MPLVPPALACFVGLSLVLLAPADPKPPTISVVEGYRPDGTATALWLAVLRRRLPLPAYDSVAALRPPLLPEQREWATLITTRAKRWSAAAIPLMRLFDSSSVASVTIVLGNHGAEDAFTHDSLTIGFDLAALVRVYGMAAQPENGDRLDRFFRHEFVHILQKRWLARRPYEPQSPVEIALLDAWAEGLGNYYSLSPRWYPTPAGPSPVTTKALNQLQPRFLERMRGLACAEPAAAGPLLADLSAGPFDQKWGALPVALWLLADASGDPTALHRFAIAGPAGVWDLAERHLPPALRDSLRMVRATAHSCPPGP